MAKFILAILIITFSTLTHAWTYVPKSDPFTDEDLSYVYQFGDDGESFIQARCDPEGFNISVGATTITLPQNAIKVVWRFDKGEVFYSGEWDGSINRRGAYVPVDRIKSVLQGLIKGTTLVVRLYDAVGKDHTYSFDLMGFRAAGSKLKCHMR